MLKVAIVGLGSIAPVHLQAIAAYRDAHLVAGCDIREERRGLLPDTARFYLNYEDMAQKEELDAVHICLPHWLHYPAASFFAGKGVHVFLEKPPALSAEDTRRLSALEEEHGARICVCLQNRFNETSQALLSELAGGAWGPVRSLRGLVLWQRAKAYYEAGPWRGKQAESGGGCLINQAIHTLDLLLYFAGAPLQSLRANYLQLIDLGLDVEDSLMAKLRFENGAEGLMIATIANDRDDDVEIRVVCEKAEFLIQGRELWRIQEGKRTLLAQNGVPTTGKACYGNSHAKLIALFYDALQGGEGRYPHPADSLPVMQALEDIRISSRRKDTMI